MMSKKYHPRDPAAAGLPSSVRQAFVSHRGNAKRRGIQWDFTFSEWWKVWQESGCFDKRGRGSDAYVMARRGDTGPYRPDNVYICTLKKNIQDGFKFKPASVRRRRPSLKDTCLGKVRNILGTCGAATRAELLEGLAKEGLVVDPWALSYQMRNVPWLVHRQGQGWSIAEHSV